MPSEKDGVMIILSSPSGAGKTTLAKLLSEKNNLTILAQKLEKAQFHIHSYTIEEILTSNHEDYFFICDHS